MRSYFACSLLIAMLVAAGCKDDHPGTDAGDAKKDGTGDGISLSDRADLGGSDRADVGTDTGGGDTGTEVGTDTGNDGGTPDAGDGGDGGGTPTCTDGIKNSDETGIDCGGHCGKCGPGNPCAVNADCTFACKADKTCAACNAAADCPGTESECQHRTCTAGACGNPRETAGTVLTVQTSGDCKHRVCAADGSVTVANDDTDVPDDRNACTNDICTTGTPSHTMMPAGSNCGGANTCNAAGQCVGCAVAADCPGTDTACRTRTCSTSGVCGFNNVQAGTKLADPTAGDCKGLQCDGNGNTQVYNVDADLPVDGNLCTTDECSAGTPTHRNIQSGTNCGGSSSSLVCDGASHCVECLTASTCPGTDADCHTRSCVAGQCGVTNLAAGTLIATQTPRDCKKTVCNGQGSTMTANDDLDLPFDNNVCTQDVCTAGTPSNPNVTAGNSCGTNTICDGQGACVACISPSTCPGTDTDCHHRTCVNGACGTANTAAGMAISAQMTGDCKVVQCDGSGQTMTVNDDTDLPVDGNACTGDVCTNGTKSNPNLSTGTVCGTNLMCNGQGACVGCVTAANCGTDSFCQTHTCTNGTCGVTNTAVGTALPTANQTARDCKVVQCDGNGQILTVNDDTDKPVDGNQCTKDVCTAGVPTNPPEDANATCNMSNGTRCNGTGSCVQCLQPTDCTGTDTECHHRACSSTGQCSIVNEADGKLMTGQTPADCKKNVCMNGAPAVANDDTDVLVDGNGCTMDLCSNGTRSNPPLAANATCNEDGGTRCNGSATAPACVQCLMNSHCGTNTLCRMFTCDSAGQCNTTDVPVGTQVGTQMTGDCRKNVCNGTGSQVSAVDNADLPADGNQCTGDVCTGGNPSNPPLAAGAACNQGNGNTMCNGSATAPACVQCLDATDCGTNTACKTFTCSSAGVCGSTNTQDGTFVSGGDAGDCHKNACMTGAITSVPDDTDLPVDGNLCTNDVCSNGNQSNPNRPIGFSCGPSLMCDGAGNCVGCVMATDCPAAPNVCQVRVCMTGGVCGYNNEAVGSHVTNTQVGDCHHDECNGSGDVVNVIDDNDKPIDTNPCTNDVCTAGIPSNDFSTAGTACTDNSKPLATQCDGAGVCVECLNASTCPGDDDACHARTCLSGVCGISNQPPGTAWSVQMSNDCQKDVCDAFGGHGLVPDDTDLPADTNQCRTPMCVGGVPMTPPKPHGTSCNQSGGRTCDSAGACLLTYHLVRVGAGSVALSNVATATFVEEHKIDGTLVNTVALPIAESGSTHAFALSGTASSVGSLSLSGDGRYVVLGGWNRAVGITGNVGNTTALAVNKMAARVDAAGNFDTSTLFGNTALSGDNIRGAATDDGTRFWINGAASTASQGGIWYAPIGTTTAVGGTQISNTAANGRCLGASLTQLYGTSNTSPNINVFTVAGGLPATGLQTTTKLTNMPDSTGSPFSFAFVDVDGNNVIDTVYVADDGSTTHGIQKWTLSGSNWSLFTTFNQPTALNFHGVAAYASGGTVTIIANTDEGAALNHVIVFTDPGGVLTLTGTPVNTAATNTMYRGIALSPHL